MATPADTYKIVLTKEKRGIYFTAVPHKWEHTKTLFWPDKLTHSQRELLRSDASSKPDGDWTAYTCIMKCKNIPTFEEALNLEKQLTECTDTEAEEELFEKIVTNVKKKTYGFEMIDRNNLFSTNTDTSQSNIIIDEIPFVIEPEFVPPNDKEQPDMQLELKEIVLDVQKEIKELKQEVSEIKKHVKEQGTRIYLLIDKIFEKLDNMVIIPPNNEVVKENQPVNDYLKNYDFPLKTSEELTQIERDIKINVTLKDQLMFFLSTIGGTTGQEDAMKIAYKIIDVLILPEVLTEYSWTGVSRKKGSEGKKPFHNLEGLLNVIFEVLLKADNRHTKERNEKIFKEGILKHAKKRSERKMKKITQAAHEDEISNYPVTAEDGNEDEIEVQ